jgi:hypothetical protein
MPGSKMARVVMIAVTVIIVIGLVASAVATPASL